MNISVDLAVDQVKFLERVLGMGQYRSRSEVVRDIIRRAEFEWEWKKGLEEAQRKGVSESVEKEREAAFASLGKRFSNAL